MDLVAPPELKALVAVVEDFLRCEVRPVEEGMDFEDPAAVDGAVGVVRSRACAAGLYAPHMPEALGGQSLSTLGTALLVQAVARSGLWLGPFVVGPPSPWAPHPMLAALPATARDLYLPALMRGEETMAFALTEPGAGSDAGAITTRARRDRDGWRIDGVKHYITGGERASVAIVFAVTDPDAPTGQRVTAFAVPGERLTVGRIDRTMIDEHHPAELVFDGVYVPGDHVVGAVGGGFGLAMRFLDAGRVYVAARCLGYAQWCLAATVEHVTNRRVFGRALAEHRSVAFTLAEVRTEIEAMTWMVRAAAVAVDTDQDARTQAAMAKYHVTERSYRVADRCLQLFVGYGLLRDGRIEAILRELRMFRIVEGASEVHKVLIARSLGLTA